MFADRAMAQTLSRERLVQLISTLLSKQGATMVAEVEKRIASGEGLEVKGIKVDTNILLDALELHSAGQAPPEALKEEPRVSARWCPAGSGGSRWSPGEASSSLLTSKAIMECEAAEPFSRNVQVLAETPIFPRPDVLEKPLENLLPTGQREVVARFLSRRDGRVYLRLKAETGWITTRSCEDLAIVVLTPEEKAEPLEPAKFRTWPLKSPAFDTLPVLESAEEAENVAPAEKDEQAAEKDEESEDAGDGAAGSDQEFPESPVPGTDEEVESQSCEESLLEDAEHADDHEEEFGSQDHPEDSAHAAPKVKRRLVRKFWIISGRTPILRQPGMPELFRSGQKMLQKGETFLADGVYWAKSEQRAYLRMTRGLGWICERSKNDLWRLSIVRLSQRKAPVSKKMARAVAFRGGDTGGVIRLQKDDLTKNSRGRIVSKRASEAAKKRNNENFGKWTEAVKRARMDLNVSGFAAVKKGTELYEKAQEHFKALK